MTTQIRSSFLIQKWFPNYLDVRLKVFKKGDNRDLCMVPNLTLAETNFSQFKCLKSQLIIAAETFSRQENFSPVQTPTTSKDMHEQLRLAHKVFDVVDRPLGKICVTLLP